MANVIVSLHPKEVKALLEAFSPVESPVLTLHSVVVIEAVKDKVAPKNTPTYVVMRTGILTNVDAGIGKFCGFLTSVSELDRFITDNYDNVEIRSNLKQSPISGHFYKVVSDLYFYLIPID